MCFVLNNNDVVSGIFILDLRKKNSKINCINEGVCVVMPTFTQSKASDPVPVHRHFLSKSLFLFYLLKKKSDHFLMNPDRHLQTRGDVCRHRHVTLGTC